MKIACLLASAGLAAVALSAGPVGAAVAGPAHTGAAAAPVAANAPLPAAASLSLPATSSAVAAARPAAPVRLPAATGPAARGDVDSRDPAVTYTQAGSTVTAHRDGHAVARITLRSLTRQGSSGRLVLTVTPVRPFTLHAADLVWEDQQGGEIAPRLANRVVYVSGHSAQVDVDYTGITAGAVVWVPGVAVAGVWGVA